MPRKASLAEISQVKAFVFVECVSSSGRLKYVWLGEGTFTIYALTSNRLSSMDFSFSSSLRGAATLVIYLCPHYRMRMYVTQNTSAYHM